MNRRRFLTLLAATPAALPLARRSAFGQIPRRSEIFELVGKYNFALRKFYPTAERYMNVIDIGHAELAEILITGRGEESGNVPRIELGLWNRVSAMFLDPKKAPRLAVSEELIAPESSKVAWRLELAFDWAHALHRQIFDILASKFPPEQKQQWVREAYNFYRSEPRRCFPPTLKTHDLMEHQWFSQYWRMKYPRFNGAIWAYHWYQLRLNEVLLASDPEAQRRAVGENTAMFRAMFENPDLLPKHMPMAHEVAPTFLAKYPDVANVFDNLHSFHDIYNDLLAHPKIADKQAEIYRQLDVYLEPGSQLETAPMHPLPANLSADELRRLNRLTHLEHMAMMVMNSSDDELAFLREDEQARAAIVETLMPVMAHTWPNFEKKHAERGHAVHEHR
jgi:hypothetical protein